MSLKPLNRFLKSIHLRQGVIISFVFLSGFVLFFSIAFLSLRDKLYEQEEEFIFNKLLGFYAQYVNEGADALYDRALLENSDEDETSYFLRIINADGQLVNFYMPSKWNSFDTSPLEKINYFSNRTIFLFSSSKDFQLVSKGVMTPDKTIIQVGVSGLVRSKMINVYRRHYFGMLPFIILLSLIGGGLSANRALKHLKSLNQQISRIEQTANLSTRLKISGTGDQLDELTGQINGMLIRIEDLVASMQQTLDNVAHDLRTPLTRLQGKASLLLEKEENDPELLREGLATAIEESSTILLILNSLMDISAAERGLMPLNKELIPVHSIVEQVVDFHTIIAEEKNIEIIAIPSEKNINIFADRSLLIRVLSNLLDNSIKFSAENSKILIDFDTLGKKDEKTVIRVKDEGPGIPEKDLPHIWQRLYRGEASRTSKGFGLGLSMVKAIIKANNGKISGKNRQDKGTIFKIILPSRE